MNFLVLLCSCLLFVNTVFPNKKISSRKKKILKKILSKRKKKNKGSGAGGSQDLTINTEKLELFELNKEYSNIQNEIKRLEIELEKNREKLRQIIELIKKKNDEKEANNISQILGESDMGDMQTETINDNNHEQDFDEE